MARISINLLRVETARRLLRTTPDLIIEILSGMRDAKGAQDAAQEEQNDHVMQIVHKNSNEHAKHASFNDDIETAYVDA